MAEEPNLSKEIRYYNELASFYELSYSCFAFKMPFMPYVAMSITATWPREEFPAARPPVTNKREADKFLES